MLMSNGGKKKLNGNGGRKRGSELRKCAKRPTTARWSRLRRRLKRVVKLSLNANSS